MKHLLQCVVFLLMPLVAIPPALARGICVATARESVSMDCCDAASVVMADAVTAIQGCGKTCCTIAPGKWPAPAIPDKLTADSTAPDASQTALSTATRRPLTWAFPVAAELPGQDLPVLLHTFRI